MLTRQLPTDEPGSLNEAVRILKQGGLVAFPTDTVYGVGALAFDEAAVESIYLAKGRPADKGIPILISDFTDLEKICFAVSPMARRLATNFWPGPLTLVVPKIPSLPGAVSNTAGVAVRIPDHAVARSLLHLAGPMAVTSANISGEASPVNAQDVFRQLDGRISLILDGGQTPGGVPSTLVDCMGSEPVILRQGPIALDQILQILSDS